MATQYPGQRLNAKSYDIWATPPFIDIKIKKSKRLCPYLETEIWDRDELFTIIKYEPYKRNKVVLALLWDLDARSHEVTLLKIKHIRIKEKYGEGQIISVDANASPQKDIKKAGFDLLKSLQDAFQEIVRNCCKRGC